VAESTLSNIHTDIAVSVADYLGYSRTAGNWTATDSARIDEYIKMGLNRFYNPPPIQGFPPGYTWSFLTVSTTLATVVSTEEYSLPDDFGVLVDGFKFSDNLWAYQPIHTSKDVYDRYRDLLSTTNGRPTMYAVFPQSVSGAAGQRFKVGLYPKADAIYPLRYSYRVLPNTIVSGSLYPYGGALHAETIKAACLSMAELAENGAPGYWNQYFMERLTASLNLDLASSAVDYRGRIVGRDPREFAGDEEQDWHDQINQGPVVP